MTTLETPLANSYNISFAQNYQQMTNFGARLRQYEGLLERAELDVSRVSSSRDEMMHGKFNTEGAYFAVGRSALHLVLSALIANDLDIPT